MADFTMPFVDSKKLPKEPGPLRYLEAVAPDFHDPSNRGGGGSLDPAKPRYSRDTILNALAQHGALRLNAKRAMISIVTRSAQYVVAESTRTMSLRSGDQHSPDDGLWMGCCVLPTSAGLCQWTVSLADPHINDTGSVDSLQDDSYFAVSDFTKDERFKEAPFVVGAPFMRFYVGVPIYSKSTGKPIGSYCILDDKPTDDLHPEALDFLKEMADAVAEHFELARIKLERHRSEKMVRGIGRFIEGKSSIEEWWPVKKDHFYRTEFGPSDEMQSRMNQKENQSRRSSTTNPMSPRSEITSPPIQSPQGDSDDPLSHRLSSFGPPSHDSKPDDLQSISNDSLSTEVNGLFSRASNIIREATELQSIQFFDATFAGLRSSHHGLKKQKNGGSPTTSGEELSLTENEDAPDTCGVLGSSTSDSLNVRSLRGAKNDHSIDERYLRALLRRYPTGKIFHLDDLSSSDSETASAFSDDRQEDTASPTGTMTGGEDETRAKRKIHVAVSRRNDAATMARIFPGARSLAFFPLWDSQKGRWFAGAIAYTNQATRFLTVEGELSYLAAFGNSIMAEVLRIVAQRADRAKSDFISSISHELRSPLHGILGNAEFLKATPVDALQTDMIHSIETCGRTLLDTVNHLLDFAKINNFLRSTSKSDMNRRSSKTVGTGVKSNPKAGMMMLESDLDLAILTEEVLQTAFSGHNFHISSRVADPDFVSSPGLVQKSLENQFSSKNRVIVILDIQPADSYVFHAQGGALRRILMNACGNALKYTYSGFVRVKLQRRSLPPSAEAEKSEVTITVSDSGKGISKAYLRERLYTPFAQEDPHSPGTGLGLSILKQITTSLQGSIDVQSERNIGTTLRLTLTLKHSKVNRDSLLPHDMQPVHDHDEVLGVAAQTKGWTARVSGFLKPIDPMTSQKSSDITSNTFKASELLEQSMINLCQSWFKMRVDTSSESAKVIPNIYVTNEAGADELKCNTSTSRQTPVIVVCPDSESAAAATAQLKSNERDIAFYCVAQPLGPVKFAKVLTAILTQVSSENVTKPVAITIPNTLLPNSENGPEGQKQVPLEPRKDLGLDTTTTNHEATSIPSAPASDIKILLVDDNIINLQLLVKFCKKQSVPYATATNGLEALEAYKAANGAFDCVLMDISMPVMDGMEATREIRRYERETGIKPATVVALTGLASESAQQEAFGSGIDLFLTKPVRLQELKGFLQTRKDDRAMLEASKTDNTE